MKYEVTVGNIGRVLETSHSHIAMRCYMEYVELSKTGYGRVPFEDVALWEDNEPIETHIAKRPPTNGQILSQFI
jgi:hypothetical protein